MSYSVYKIMHVVSIVIFFSLYGMACVKAQKNTDHKLEKILTGVLLLIIIASGMGLGARLGVLKGGFPFWVNVKMAIWFIIGIGGTIVLKRIPHNAIKFFWFSVGLLILASYMANYKLG